MLVIKDEKHLEEVKKFAKEREKLYQLEEKLEYLKMWGCSEQEPERTRCTLLPDKTDKINFHVVMERKDKMTEQYLPEFVGLLIYTQLNPTQSKFENHGWKFCRVSY